MSAGSLDRSEERAIREFLQALIAAENVPMEDFSGIAKSEVKKLRKRVRKSTFIQFMIAFQEFDK